MGLDELIQNLESLISQMEYVKDGEYVFSRHTNLFVDFLKDAIEVCKELYQKFKDKTGKTLPKAEEWLSMAETRYGFTRKVAFGDTVLPSDHNLIIDTLKPLEMVLREIEKNL